MTDNKFVCISKAHRDDICKKKLFNSSYSKFRGHTSNFRTPAKFVKVNMCRLDYNQFSYNMISHAYPI